MPACGELELVCWEGIRNDYRSGAKRKCHWGNCFCTSWGSLWWILVCYTVNHSTSLQLLLPSREVLHDTNSYLPWLLGEAAHTGPVFLGLSSESAMPLQAEHPSSHIITFRRPSWQSLLSQAGLELGFLWPPLPKCCNERDVSPHRVFSSLPMATRRAMLHQSLTLMAQVRWSGTFLAPLVWGPIAFP